MGIILAEDVSHLYPIVLKSIQVIGFTIVGKRCLNNQPKKEKSMKYISTILTFFLVLGLSFQNLYAAAPTWKIDEGHSNIYFSVKHIYSKIHGSFDKFSSKISFAPDNLKESSISFTIKVKSINTNNGKRDKHLLSPDFFDAKSHPEITFQSTAITSSGNNTFDVAGKLGVKGKSYDIVLPLVFEGTQEHPMQKGHTVAGFNGKLKLDRIALDVGSGKFLGVVGKDVDVLVTLEALNK
jgi:polyisoprenoid-binding protein YceI